MNNRYYYSCSVFGCSNTTKNCAYTFFKFPNDIERRTLWLSLIDREDVTNKWSTCLRVCESHFETNSLLKTSNRTLLKKGTNPKLLLPVKKNENIESQATEETSESSTQYEKGQCHSSSQTAARLSANSPRKRKLKNNIRECRKRLKTMAAPETDTNEQDSLRKIIGQCRFCGETNKECIDVAYLPYLNKSKTSIVFNDISIQLYFSSTVLPNSVCDDCNVKLQEMRDFIILVQEAQEKFQVETKSNSKKAKKTVTRNHTDDEDTNDPYENKRSIRNDNDDVNTSLAFEGEDLQIEYEPTEPKEGSNVECEIKMEYESDDNDNKEAIVDSLTIEESILFRETHKKIVDTAKRKAEVKTEEFIFDMDIKKEVIEMDNTNVEAPAISGSGVSDSSSVGYISIDGMTGTLSVEQGKKGEIIIDNRIIQLFIVCLYKLFIS